MVQDVGCRGAELQGCSVAGIQDVGCSVAGIQDVGCSDRVQDCRIQVQGCCRILVQ